MRLTNFRQYAGQTIINFSTDKEKPLTLFHGENGAGKSAILNAMTWCLFDTTTLKDPNKLMNKDVLISNKKAKGMVEIYFLHEGNRYRAWRTFSSERPSDMYLSMKDEDGNYNSLTNPKPILNAILPYDIHSYYLFSGESESLTDTTTGGAKIKDSIGTILGMDAAKEAIGYIETSRKNIEKKIAASTETSDQLTTLQNAIDEQDEFITKRKEHLLTVKNQAALKETRYNQITEDTKELPKIDITELQEETKTNLGTLKIVKDDIAELRAEEIKVVRKSGWKVIGEDIFKKVADLLEKSTEDGEIPGNYKKEIVEKSIADCKCMLCKTNAGEKEIRELRRALNELVQSEAVHRALELKGDLKVFLEGKDHFTSTVLGIQRRETLLAKDELEIKEKLKKNQTILEQIKDVDLQKLLKEQKVLKPVIESLTKKIDKLEEDIYTSESHLKVQERNYEKEKIKQSGLSGKLKKLFQKRDFLKDSAEYGNGLIEEAEDAAVIKIQETVNDILTKCFRKTVTAKIDEDFAVSLQDIQGNLMIGESKGEGKFLNFAFTLALSSLSRERSALDNDYFVSGANAPFFVDAPFDALGQGYQESVARYMTSLSDQVGIFALPDDSMPIRESIKDKIGKEYVISYFSPEKKRKESDVSETLTIDKKDYKTIEYEADFEHSEIVEVE